MNFSKKKRTRNETKRLLCHAAMNRHHCLDNKSAFSSTERNSISEVFQDFLRFQISAISSTERNSISKVFFKIFAFSTFCGQFKSVEISANSFQYFLRSVQHIFKVSNAFSSTAIFECKNLKSKDTIFMILVTRVDSAV